MNDEQYEHQPGVADTSLTEMPATLKSHRAQNVNTKHTCKVSLHTNQTFQLDLQIPQMQ